MSEKITLREIFKSMPAYIADGFCGAYNYWRQAPLRMWVAETLWLTILVVMFYYGIYGTIGLFETTTIDRNSALGWFISFLPLWFVFAILMVHWMFSSLVKIVFEWMDNHANRDNT